MRTLLAAAGVLCAFHAFAQAPYLVSDINTSFTPSAQSSLPKNFTSSGASVYFSAASAATGTELFKTDGATVQLVKDLRLGTSSSTPQSLLDLGNGTFVFSAVDDTNGRELWSSDGSEAGTGLVKDILGGSGSSGANPFVAIGGKAFLLATTAAGQTLWITDGQLAGTQQLATVASGPFRYAVLGSVLYFSSGDAFWRSDGTPGGTSVVKSGISPRNITATADKLFLTAWDIAHGYELWKSDGTDAGTTIVKDINAGAAGSFNTNSTISMALIGSSVLFFASDGAHDLSLWRSDGTDAGTTLFHEFDLASTTVAPFLRSAAGVAFFAMNGSLWRTDGTSAGTFSLPEVIDPYYFITTPATLYFVASDATTGIRLWKSDGSDEGTEKIAPNVLLSESDPQLRFLNGKLYFAGSSGLTGIEPWTSDGTAAGTVMLANLMSDPPASANPSELRAAGDKVFFTANNGTAPSQLWRSIGTGPGTIKLTSFADTGYTTLSGQTAWNGQLYFYHQNELWKSDGTVAGTALLKQINVGTLFPASNYLYFTGYEGSDYYHRLWRTDGTLAGTIQLSTPTYYSSYTPVMIGEIAGRFYYVAEGSLWRTEGTAATTVKIAPLGYYSYTPVIMGGTLYYSSASEYPNYELWKTDGTPEGASLVKEIRTGSAASNPRNLTPSGALLYFTADNGTNGEELWRTDGTEAGTFLLKDILPGAGSSTPGSFVAVNGSLYFSANNGVDGYELWKSDGTVAGTILVADINPGATSSDPQQLAAADGKIWFAATTPTAGTELWTSDGTPAGTTMVSDLEPGSGSSSPREMTSAGRRLYFAATTAAGRELWALQLAATAYTIADARIVEQDSGTQLLHFTVTRSGDISAAATVAFATSNATATAGSDYVALTGSLPFTAGAATAFVDIQILSDDVIEKNENFFLTISAPSSGVIERNLATGWIEDDDRASALSVALIPDAYNNGTRKIVVTNAGPSSANDVQLRYVESPRNPSFYNYSYDGATSCTAFTAGSLCTLGTLLPGESRTVTLSRNYDYYLYTDPDHPAGQTGTATVSATEADPDPSNNTMARMFSENGSLMTPALLVSNTSAAAEYMMTGTSGSPTTVTLASTNPLVVPSGPNTIPAGQLGTTFALQVGNGTGTTKLSAGTSTAMFISIVSPGGTAKLDTVIKGPSGYNYYRYGDVISIPVQVTGSTADGTLPSGTVQLLDEGDNVLTQATLDATAKATFTRSGLLPGDYTYRVRYLGDTKFNTLTVTIPGYHVDGWSTYTSVLIPRVICGNTLDVRVTVSTQYTTQPPTGQVKITLGNQVVTLNLTAGTDPGTATATTQMSVPQSYYSIQAEYLATGTFQSSYGYDYLPAVGGCGPLGLAATATATNRVSLTWNSTGASSYEIHRAESSSGFSVVGNATTNFYLDTQVQPNRTYIYRVRPLGGLLSEPDIATTFFFTTDPLVAHGTAVKALHFTQIRTAANYARSTARLAASPAGANPPAAPGLIRPVHITELRTMIDETRRYLGLLPLTYTDPTLTTAIPIKAVHLQELRNALK
jgi:ELWxxDGT repeat protein